MTEVREVEKILRCVRAPHLGCYDEDECWRLGRCGFSRDEDRRRMQVKPDPKPVPRIKDPAAVRRKVRADRVCRCGCGQPATDGHHILPRSLGGDDVEQNIMGLFHDCHMSLEFDAVDGPAMRALVGSQLRPEEIRYTLEKRGVDGGAEFLKRYYDCHVSAADARDILAEGGPTR